MENQRDICCCRLGPGEVVYEECNSCRARRYRNEDLIRSKIVSSEELLRMSEEERVRLAST